MITVKKDGVELQYLTYADFLDSAWSIANSTHKMKAYYDLAMSINQWGEIDEDAAADLGFTI